MKNIIITTIIASSVFDLNTISSAVTYYDRFAGVQYQTIIGEVVSVNTAKNIFVIEDKDAGTKTTVSTDSQTIASLSKGKIVRVTLKSGSPIAQTVAVGN